MYLEQKGGEQKKKINMEENFLLFSHFLSLSASLCSLRFVFQAYLEVIRKLRSGGFNDNVTKGGGAVKCRKILRYVIFEWSLAMQK